MVVVVPAGDDLDPQRIVSGRGSVADPITGEIGFSIVSVPGQDDLGGCPGGGDRAQADRQNDAGEREPCQKPPIPVKEHLVSPHHDG